MFPITSRYDVVLRVPLIVGVQIELEACICTTGSRRRSLYQWTRPKTHLKRDFSMKGVEVMILVV